MFSGADWLPYKRWTNKKAVKNSLLKANNQTFVQKCSLVCTLKENQQLVFFNPWLMAQAKITQRFS